MERFDRGPARRQPSLHASFGRSPQDGPTSFGVVAVEGVTQTAGPTAKALAGMTHGVGNLVPPDKI